MKIINPETVKSISPGKVGEVVVIPIDAAYPLIRFGTGDLACIIDEPCPCGRTFSRLTRILERVGDAVRTRGMFVFPRQLELGWSSFHGIQHQTVVTRPGYRDEFTLKVELKSEEGV